MKTNCTMGIPFFMGGVDILNGKKSLNAREPRIRIIEDLTSEESCVLGAVGVFRIAKELSAERYDQIRGQLDEIYEAPDKYALLVKELAAQIFATVNIGFVSELLLPGRIISQLEEYCDDESQSGGSGQ